ncbi:MAG: L,D-transpeptidase [Chloroflexi bacterium]|nr:L,D-transpeptidase [Chloroflexota bacterium]
MPDRLVTFLCQPTGRVGLTLSLIFSLFSITLLNTPEAQARHEPGDVAVNSSRLYFEETGHSLGNTFLDYWRTQGGYMEFGPPLTEELVEPNQGKTVQYFAKARFELASLPDGNWRVDLGLINREILTGRPPLSEEQSQALKPLTKGVGNANTRFFKETGHTLGGGFLARWTDANGIGNRQTVTQLEEISIPLLRHGLPLSEPYNLTIKGMRYKVQDFERTRMLLNADGSVLLDDIGTLTPGLTESLTQREANILKAPIYSRKTVPRWVDINLTTQTSNFIEGGIQVRRSLITSGEWKFETPTGSFAIFSRVPNERMINGKPGDPDYYDLANVLYTQYFTKKGHALHYAWWRTTFGYRDSHGCINEDISTSRYAWDFLTIGDNVVIHY